MNHLDRTEYYFRFWYEKIANTNKPELFFPDNFRAFLVVSTSICSTDDTENDLENYKKLLSMRFPEMLEDLFYEDKIGGFLHHHGKLSEYCKQEPEYWKELNEYQKIMARLFPDK